MFASKRLLLLAAIALGLSIQRTGSAQYHIRDGCGHQHHRSCRLLDRFRFRSSLRGTPGFRSRPGCCAPFDYSSEMILKQQSLPSQSSIKVDRLFDGKSLDGWIKTNFGGEGEIDIQDGAVSIQMGNGLTGIHLDSKNVPRDNYRLELKAKRIDGEDMLCGITFPVGDEFCSLIVGGWGGSTIGISSVNQRDASDNETTQIRKIEHHQWYTISISVSGRQIVCKLDDDTVVNLDATGKKLSLRGDCDLAQPIGIFSFGTEIAVKDIMLFSNNMGSKKSSGNSGK